MSTPPQQVIDKDESEREIKALSDEYNSNAEKLNAAEVRLNELKDKSYTLLRRLYQLQKSDTHDASALDALERQYNISEHDVNEARLEHYEWMSVCFRQIQKLRLLQTNYLVAVINSLQKEVADLKQPSESFPHVREDNLTP